MASAGVTVELKPGDLATLERKLRSLEVRVQRKVLRKGTRAASTPIMKAVKKAAPVGPGSKGKKGGKLKESIGRKFKFYRSSLTDVAVIGPRINEAKDWKGFLGWIVEFGTGERTVKDLWGRFKAGLVSSPVSGSTGRMPANPFAKRAADSVLASAGRKGVEAIRKALDEEVKKLGRGR